MEFINQLQGYLYTVNERQFRLYMFFCIGTLFLISAGIAGYYLTTKQTLAQRREYSEDLTEQAQKIIIKAKNVEKQRKDVDTLLKEGESFKIGGYFKEITTQLQIADKQGVINYSLVDRDHGYKEGILNAQFSEMNMKELCELLDVLEKNERIYTKELQIMKSKKKNATIDVTLIIATLQKK